MKPMRTFVIVCSLILLFTLSAFAQDSLESSWKVSLTGGYSNLSNQPTNNGYLTSLGVRVAKHWNARLDNFSVGSPKAAVIVAGPEYNFSLKHYLPASDFFDVSKIEVFVNARIGAGRGAADSAPFKFAAAAGLGINYRVSDRYLLRPLEVSYVRSPGFSNFIGNHAQFASSIGLRF